MRLYGEVNVPAVLAVHHRYLTAASVLHLSKPLTLPDGTQGFAIKCDRHLHDMNDCMAEAGKMCPLGYNVLDGSTESSPVSLWSAYASAGSNGAHAGSTSFVGAMVFRSMMVRCHGAKAS